MKIVFDHGEEDIAKLIEGSEIEDKDVEMTDEEIREVISVFAKTIQGFEIGIFVAWLGIKRESDIDKVSVLAEALIEDGGWDVFVKFTNMLAGIALGAQEGDEGASEIGDDSVEN